MTKGRKKAIADPAQSLRGRFSDNAGLSDEQIVSKFVEEEQVGNLASYYDILMSPAKSDETIAGP
jgi:hypothetical protein